MKPSHWHYSISLLLGIALVPLLRRLHLPVAFDWTTLAVAYWLVLASQSIFVAAILCLIGFPRQLVLTPLVDHYRREPLRIVLVLIYALILFSTLTWMKACILTVDTVAILEYREREGFRRLRQCAGSVLLPGLYLFAGFLVVLAYNSIIVSVHWNFAYDPAFNAIDKWMLHGRSVSDLSHWALGIFPLSFFKFLEFIYFGMFPQIGASIILVSLVDGKNRGLQFVGTILMAYYLALGLFYLWPSQGPYYSCPAHFLRFPDTLQAYSIQKLLIEHAQRLWDHVPVRRISADYFIAFPCMHIAQPIVVVWYLRRWRGMVFTLCAYDAILIVAILLLEWHYLADIIAGVLVACSAIAITDGSSLKHLWLRRGADISKENGILSPG